MNGRNGVWEIRLKQLFAYALLYVILWPLFFVFGMIKYGIILIGVCAALTWPLWPAAAMALSSVGFTGFTWLGLCIVGGVVAWAGAAFVSEFLLETVIDSVDDWLTACKV